MQYEPLEFIARGVFLENVFLYWQSKLESISRT
jgi:hypothetical protein